MNRKTIFFILIGIVVLIVSYFGGMKLLTKFFFEPPCRQVVVMARNQSTGEEKQFSNPCKIPDGWKEIPFDPIEQEAPPSLN